MVSADAIRLGLRPAKRVGHSEREAMPYTPDVPLFGTTKTDEGYWPPVAKAIEAGADEMTLFFAMMGGDQTAFEAEMGRVGLSRTTVPAGTSFEIEEICDGGPSCNHGDRQYLATFTDGPLAGEQLVFHDAQVNIGSAPSDPVVINLSDESLEELLKSWDTYPEDGEQ